MSHSDCCTLLTTSKLRMLLALLPLLFRPVAGAHAQCILVCNDGLQVSLDATGQASISPFLIAPDAATSCPGTLQLKLLTEQGQLIPNNILTCNHVGQTITAQVKHLASGNSCSGTLQVQDFLPPALVCTDKFIFCNHDPSPASVDPPAMTDNCTPDNELTVNYFDNEITLPCGTVQNGQPVIKRIDRTWIASDEYGNSSGCVQKIWLKHITFANVTFPPHFNGINHPALNCDQNPYDLSLTGRPSVEGVPIDNSTDCEFGVAYSDQVVNICPPAGYSVIRTWTAIDFCNSTVTNRVQIIKVEDKTPPVIAPLSDITVGTGGLSCTAIVELPQAETSDDCSAVSVTASWNYGTGFGPFIGVEKGEHLVTYTATDDCGNSSTATLRVTIVDAGPPLAICAANLQVSITATGFGYVNAGSLNAGSFDNCGSIVLSISRDDTIYASAVQVSCADIGPPLPLILKVTDAEGLENFCTGEVNVRDFLKPVLQCPANVTLSCLQDYTDLQLTGHAVASDNCALQSLDYVDVTSINACNIGAVARIWKAVDVSGNVKTCLQQIALQALSDISVVFPPNVTVAHCADPSAFLPPATGAPLTSGQYCSPLSVTYTDQLFPTAPAPACYRILRRWKVIDFCIYDPNNNSAGIWEQIQTIDIVDDVPPVLLLPADLTVAVAPDACVAAVLLPEVTATDCSSQIAIIHNSPYAALPGSNASGSYPPGIYMVVFTATDECGNSAQQTLTLTVLDTVAPAAVCNNGITLPLTASGTATLDAALLDGGTADNCSPASSLSFSASPDNFTCQNIGSQTVVLTVSDAAGNTSTCAAALTVADPTGACLPPAFDIEGTIRTAAGDAVAEIPVTLSGDGFIAVEICDLSGGFRFEDVPASNIYTLKPQCNDKWLNGVSTFDLVLISKHILGLTPFDSPFKIIAADANRSGSVTSLDIVQLRKLILGLADTVPGNSSWRFLDAGFNFPNPVSPLGSALPGQLTYNGLDSNYLDQDFTGIKTGDVNFSANAADPRSLLDTLFLHIPDLDLKAGDTAALPVFLSNWPQLEGLQVELDFDTNNVVLSKVAFPRPSLLGESHCALKAGGTLTLSWDNAGAAPPAGSDSLLCTLRVYALQHTRLRAAIRINAGRISPEAYPAGVAPPATLSLHFNPAQLPHSKSFTVLPAYPNPFSGETALPFFLPEAAELSLELTDVSGKTVLSRKAYFPAGYGEWRLKGAELKGPGVYFYRFGASGAPGKLVLLER